LAHLGYIRRSVSESHTEASAGEIVDGEWRNLVTHSVGGRSGHDLELAVAIITSDKEAWLETAMREELGLALRGQRLTRALPSQMLQTCCSSAGMA
jgi:hypothetical protein